MRRVDSKVAFVTGAARGQGRSHAVRLAEEGANIIAVDICSDIETVPYEGATEEDLAQTVKLVEQCGQRIFAQRADIRDLGVLEEVARRGVDEFGRIDIVVANAGICSYGSALEIDEKSWQNVIDINLTGAWKTIKATVPTLVRQGGGGSVILISSVAGLVAYPGMAHYVTAKHGLTGLMRALSVELAPHDIRVNSIHPGTVDTPMIDNQPTFRLLTGVEDATRDQAGQTMKAMSALDVPWIESIDVSNALLYLCSEESRYVTGTTMVVDAGSAAPFKIQRSSAPATSTSI